VAGVMKVTTYLRLVPMLKMGGDICPLHMTWRGKTLPLLVHLYSRNPAVSDGQELR
jgi:hypothetical protein